MRRHRPRCTVRRLMLAVAMVTVGLGSGLMWHRSAYYRARAEEHAAGQADRQAAGQHWRSEAKQAREIAAYSRIRTDGPEGTDWQADARLR